ncbi:MAG: pentapeptide repeat-containing protein [Mycolicibacterium sp.]|nr:pentapeptide repeat-containing protein [Mycolicibacterium sp.]MCV7080550.1 pentapeptide repeat-containing protein [Mycolicibacterium insubricum]
MRTTIFSNISLNNAMLTGSSCSGARFRGGPART